MLRTSILFGCVALAYACDSHVDATPSAGASPDGGTDGASTTPATCASVVYPDAPADAGAIRYVASCTSPDLSAVEGSTGHPYASIAAALAASGDHTTLLVAAGTYEGSLHVTKDGTRIIASSGQRPEDAAALVRDAVASDAVVTVDGARDVILQGLRVVDAPATGIAIRGGAVTVRGCVVQNAQNTRGAGHGIAASGGAIIFQRNVIDGAAGVGIIFQNVAGIIFQNTARAAKGGGMLGIGPKQGDLSIDENQLMDNARFGLGLFGLEVKATKNHVTDTHADAAGTAHGIVVADYVAGNTTVAANVNLEANVVERSAGVGIIFQNQPRGIIFQNAVKASGAGGIRATVTSPYDETAEIHIEGNTVEANAGFGIALVGGRGIIFQNQVQTTTLSDLGMPIDQVGDGIAVVSSDPKLSIASNTISSAQRIGLFLVDVDAAAVVKKNVFSTNHVDIVVQGGTIDEATVYNDQPSAAPPTDGIFGDAGDDGGAGSGGASGAEGGADGAYGFPKAFPDVSAQ